MLKKFDENVRRDEKERVDLENLGWRVVTVWECELRDKEELTRRLAACLRHLSP